MSKKKIRHILHAKQFKKEDLELIFLTATEIEKSLKTKQDRLTLKKSLEDKIICTDFYEASTRTNLSFGAAALRLGAQVLNPFDPKKYSSELKGEKFEDSIRTISCYADAIVIRHQDIGITQRAAKVSTVPIINAGDGAGQHPTQALLDLFTIKKVFGSIDGVKIAMTGDLLHSRTINSLCYLLGKFNDVVIYFVSPPITAIKPGIKKYLTKHGIEYYDEASLPEALKKVDFVYMTRIQEERFKTKRAYQQAMDAKQKYIITPEILRKKSKLPFIMHPLPRDSRNPQLCEINFSVDKDPRAIYFDQVQNGLYIRMALLKIILGD